MVVTKFESFVTCGHARNMNISMNKGHYLDNAEISFDNRTTKSNHSGESANGLYRAAEY